MKYISTASVTNIKRYAYPKIKYLLESDDNVDDTVEESELSNSDKYGDEVILNPDNIDDGILRSFKNLTNPGGYLTSIYGVDIINSCDESNLSENPRNGSWLTGWELAKIIYDLCFHGKQTAKNTRFMGFFLGISDNATKSIVYNLWCKLTSFNIEQNYMFYDCSLSHGIKNKSLPYMDNVNSIHEIQTLELSSDKSNISRYINNNIRLHTNCVLFSIINQNSFDLRDILISIADLNKTDGVLLISVPNEKNKGKKDTNLISTLYTLGTLFKTISLYVFPWNVNQIWVCCSQINNITNINTKLACLIESPGYRLDMLTSKYPKTIGAIKELISKFVEDYNDTSEKLNCESFKIAEDEVIETEWVSMNISDI